jgi:hypothetical protein
MRRASICASIKNKKICAHIAHPDGKRLIPFDTYNMFYRMGWKRSRCGRAMLTV